MTDRTVRVYLRAEIADFKKKMADGARSVDDVRGGLETVSRTAGIAGAAMVATAGLALSAWIGYSHQMSAVQAATSATAAEMLQLDEAARDAGRATAFTATEAGQAQEALAKAGVSVRDILAGGLSGALDLAAAGEVSVADAADTAATAMTQFGLKGDKVSHIADLLAAGANKAQGGVGDMSMALKQAGLVSSQMGISLESTVGTLTAFASAGLIGSDAGTSFRTMLLHLANPSNEARQKMDELGIAAYDATGKFVGMQALAGQLQTRLGGLTQAQRDEALALIFGMDAIRGANVLYKQGADGIANWTKQVDVSGYAAQVARTRLDNLAGDLQKLKGSVETAGIAMGQAADGPMRGLVQATTGLVNIMSDAPPAVQTVLMAVVALGGVLLLTGAGVAKFRIGLQETRIALAAMNVSMGSVALTAVGITAGLAAASLVVAAWASNVAAAKAKADEFRSTLDEFGNTTAKSLDTIRESLSGDMAAGVDAMLGRQLGSAIDVGKKLGLSSKDLTDYVLKEQSAVDKVNRAYEDSWHNRKVTADQSERLKQVLDSLQGSFTAGERQQIQKAEADREAGAAADANTEAQQRQVDATNQAAAAQTAALQQWREAVAGQDQTFISLTGAYDAVIQKNKDLADNTAASTKSAKDSWKDYYDGVTVTADEYIAELSAQVEAQANWEKNLFDILQRSRTNLPREVQGAVDEMINDLANLGPEGAKQVQLLHDMSDDQLLQVVKLYGERGAQAAGDFAARLQNAIAAKPPVIDVTANLTPANDQVQAWLAETRRLTAGDFARTGKPAAHAGGGSVIGPGTGTSDSIPALLSNGEHVWTASEVTALGGQGAVYALRSAVRQGWRPAYAAGGAVESLPVPVPVPAYAGAPSAAPSALPRAAFRAAIDERDLQRQLDQTHLTIRPRISTHREVQ